jgi:protein tyrosine/serine phosphatase
MRLATPFLVGVLLTGCLTMQPAPCGPADPPRPPRNFGTVVPGVYRGAQPADCELAFLHGLGVRSILKLNERTLDEDREERERAAALGMTVLPLPFNAATIGRSRTCSMVREALAFLEEQDHRPVYVHCTAGKDRTGYIIGMYEKEALGKTSDEVLYELHRYGHRGLRSVVMGQIDRELASDAALCGPPGGR